MWKPFKDSKSPEPAKATSIPLHISNGPTVISKVYSGSLNDMPQDMKDIMNEMFGAPIFVGRPPAPPAPILSPFYEVKAGKVEEIVHVEPEDEEWGPWGFEEDDLSFI